MEIAYTEFRPSAHLAPYVECYWLQSFSGAPSEDSPIQRCLPLGMLEILLHPDTPVAEILQGSTWHSLPRSFFTGIYDNPVLWKMNGTARLFGIRLKPETFSQLFAVPAAALFSNFIDVETFFGEDINRLTDAVYSQRDVAGMITQTELFLSQRLTAMNPSRNYVVAAAHLIRSSHGNISIEEVSSSLSVGMRQLQRSFKDSLGTTPKGYLRIIRFRNALTALQDVHEWADITYGLGYADQAHFIREFREFAGEAPGTIIKNAHHYYKKPQELTGLKIF